MKRRDFIRIAGITTVFAGSGISWRSDSRNYKNWAWFGGQGRASDDEIKSLFERLRNNGINGILPSGGNDLYRRMGPIAKEMGMDFHAWRWTINRAGHMKDHPEWYAVSRNGDSVVDKPPYVGYYRWLCPTRPETEDLLVKDYTDLCDIEGMTGVHLDYVRYCDVILPVALQPKYNLIQDHEMPEFDFCYCELCRSRFKEEHGIDPLELEDPPANKEWHQWRLDQLVKVVNTVAERVHDKGKEISAAVFPTPSIARRIVRQDWERFKLDAFMPMIYFKDYNGDMDWVAKIVAEDVRVLNGRAKLYAGLNMGHVRDFSVKEVVNVCLENGADGISFFTGNGMSESELSEFSTTLKSF
jgi:uncharacterized lipoprotein YddW (UPF0748 family)